MLSKKNKKQNPILTTVERLSRECVKHAWPLCPRSHCGCSFTLPASAVYQTTCVPGRLSCLLAHSFPCPTRVTEVLPSVAGGT